MPDESLWARVHNHLNNLIANTEVAQVEIESGVATVERSTIKPDSVTIFEVSQVWGEGRNKTRDRTRDLSEWVWGADVAYRARVDTYDLSEKITKFVSERTLLPTFFPALLNVEVTSSPDGESNGDFLSLTFNVKIHPA